MSGTTYRCPRCRSTDFDVRGLCRQGGDCDDRWHDREPPARCPTCGSYSPRYAVTDPADPRSRLDVCVDRWHDLSDADMRRVDL